VCCCNLDPIQHQGQGHGAFELPTTSEAVRAGGDDRGAFWFVWLLVLGLRLEWLVVRVKGKTKDVL